MHRPTNGEKLTSNDTWYRDLVIGEGGVKGEAEFNWGFWGQMCGPEYDASKEQLRKYQEDAISVNTKLKETHFASHHVYRLEWQPGEEGYLEWYLDDELIFGIKGQSLTEQTGSLIPVEPMYLILNTGKRYSFQIEATAMRILTHTNFTSYHVHTCTLCSTHGFSHFASLGYARAL